MITIVERNPSNMAKKKVEVASQSWNKLIPGFLLLFMLMGLAGFMAADLPNTSTTSAFDQLNQVQIKQIIAIALAAGVTVAYLAYYRVKALFSTRWMVAAVTYNALIILIKFTLSTQQYAPQVEPKFPTILSTALLVSLLYVFASAVLYLFFDGRVLNRSLHKALIVSRDGKVILASALFVLVTFARIILFRLPGLSGTNASSYLNDVFHNNNLLLSGILFVMILAAVEAYAQVRRRADLAQFFVVSVALILSYHFAWATFMYGVLN